MPAKAPYVEVSFQECFGSNVAGEVVIGSTAIDITEYRGLPNIKNIAKHSWVIPASLYKLLFFFGIPCMYNAKMEFGCMAIGGPPSPLKGELLKRLKTMFC
ncbi:hypothetical protein [Mucilaginibacter gilvus]|uniref:Uncharacterized protein n=1 Tax=Mucilaginibacter gilvus TaxID=2305909 RepID=A0A444MP66_9SPHI|nr:hypothetical protein [Mucilaginibacter gilvus]RWY52405.1 hypothetical protein EPL05_10875 [Mucilaginibacter gilvus]